MSRLHILKEFDKRQLYRFFVDGRFYTREHGWEEYEKREPGSIEGMSLAYSYMLDNFDLKDGLSVKYICELHNLIVSKINLQARKNRYPGQIREFQVSFLLKPRTTSLEGLRELLKEQGLENGLKEAKLNKYKSIEDVYERIQNGEDVRYRAIIGKLDDELMKGFEERKPEGLYFKARKKIQLNLYKRLENHVSEYNKKINFFTNDEDKIYFIVDFVKNVVRLHPFVDGNARVVTSILLNHIFLYHGFLPVIFEEPSITDAYTTSEILKEVVEGQKLTQLLLGNPHSKVFNHSIDDESEEHHNKILDLMSNMINKLKSME